MQDKIFVLLNVPQEVYAVAAEYEHFPAAPTLELAEKHYNADADKQGLLNGGFEKALCDFFTKKNDFNDENGKYAEMAARKFVVC
jgi:hypothetical protein